jgi:uncharacterized protein (DUF2062 family)
MRHGIYERLKRLTRYRLVIPIMRSKHGPEYSARGVFIGMLVAMTPTVGAQMAIVAFLWLLMRIVRPSWEFSLIIAMAWTWVTNVVTAPPLYYLFVLTGRLMMGQWDSLTGFDEFMEQFDILMERDAGILRQFWVYVIAVFQIWGVPMFLGSLPWAIGASWVSYRWSYRIAQNRRLRRLRRAMPSE